jgi:tetratricopeptide (TPR) repeat protein
VTTAYSSLGLPGSRRRIIAWSIGALLPLTILGAWAGRRADPELLWDEAQAALQAGKPAVAEAKLARIRGLREPTRFDWMLTAQIALANGLAGQALAALGHIPEGDPLAGQALLLAGRIERQRNRMRAAEAAFRRAIAGDSRSIEAHKELIYLLGMQLRRREVDAEFKALSRLTTLSHHDLFT